MEDEIRGYFEIEARELVDRLTQGLARLLPDGEEDAGAMRELLRAAHTLKGAAHVVGERGLAGRAHAFEDAVAAYRGAPHEAGLSELLTMVDGISAELAGPAAPSGGAVTSAAARPVREAAAERAPAALRTVRVDSAQVDALVDGVGQSGELVSAMRGVLERLEALEGVGSAELRRMERVELRRRLRDQLGGLERQLQELHTTMTQLRLGSAEGLLLEAGRTVRATAAALGKHAECVTRGGAERIDVNILAALQDALLHLARNAVAHGVETPAERAAAGKPKAGTVTITVERVGREVCLRCEDDGRGISRAALRTRAVELGRAAPEEDGEVLRLLLDPAFHGGGEVNEISGRGVGLDAVQAAVERVGGKVTIASAEGRGTTFTLVIPEAAYALAALQVLVRGERYALPLGAIEQTFPMEPHHTRQAQGSRTLLVGQETMPFLRLQDAFFSSSSLETGWVPEGAGRKVCLVVADAGRRLAVEADRILGTGEVMVQTPPKIAGIAQHVAGVAQASTGKPFLVLDAAALVRMDFEGVTGWDTPVAAATPERRRILVIDDSLTTRMLEQSILETEGYLVEVAVSGEQGLAMARAKQFALFLVDVEMPGMNGYEFVSLVAADAQLKTTPAMLVTSLDSAESRGRGRSAGAAGYIVKGEFNQQEYLDRIRALVGGAA